jgi:glyoxylase-like metal-dependent hydrolase (beta-lactamase superfamily II)/rhodanese-related sulfurtransferase
MLTVVSTVFEHFYLGCLAHASYLVGSDGVAVVIDPQRDVDIYIEAAREHGLTIRHIIETHLHADFVSGHRELAERTGAHIYLGRGSGATFPHRPAKDGDEIAFGQCRMRFLETPGHTLESVCVVLTDLDREASGKHGRWAVFTGDTLFIGDVGRPDLAETRTPQQLAGRLYDSLHRKLLTLPGETLVYPAHGAGSMCGRNISSDRSSTIAHERQFNYALQPMSREQFVALMTADLPARPEYFQRDVDLNRHGAAHLAKLPEIAALHPSQVETLRAGGIALLDTRAASDFCAGHIPGSLNIGLNGQFASWAGSLLGLDRDLILVAEDARAVDESRSRLARVGIERVRGFVKNGIGGWVQADLPLEETRQISATDLQAICAPGSGVRILDVRRRAEWDSGHVVGATLAPLDRFRDEIGKLDPTQTTAVHCKGGYRSAIACSILQANGFTQVVNVTGGFDAWLASRLPVESTNT